MTRFLLMMMDSHRSLAHPSALSLRLQSLDLVPPFLFLLYFISFAALFTVYAVKRDLQCEDPHLPTLFSIVVSGLAVRGLRL
jgi:hypothetical protein